MTMREKMARAMCQKRWNPTPAQLEALWDLMLPEVDAALDALEDLSPTMVAEMCTATQDQEMPETLGEHIDHQKAGWKSAIRAAKAGA